MLKFNMALLGKQEWRLIKNPGFLTGRVLKGKYFPHGGFMDYKLGHQPSLIWRSIKEAREVLQGGVRWRAENGRSIRIWKDKWLSFQPSF